MLQQTTVGAVLGRYERFLGRFPDLPALARAREETVLAAWSGLGYYARARNLWRASREIAARHAGRLPRDPSVLRRLPGFGEYTAAAVGALAFGSRAPAADANVTRVISRVFALEGLPGTRAHRRAVLARQSELLAGVRPADLTAALMDLGQLICKPRRPRCETCPLARVCRGRRLGRPEGYPARAPRPRPLTVSMAAAVIVEDGRALLVRRSGSLLGGLWEFPSAMGATAAAARRRLGRALRDLDARLSPSRAIATARHTVVNRKITVKIHAAVRNPRRALEPERDAGVRWFPAATLSRAAIPTLTRKIGRAAGFLRPRNQRILSLGAIRPALSRPRLISSAGSFGDPDDVEERDRLFAQGASADVRRANRLHHRRGKCVLAGGIRGAVHRKRPSPCPHGPSA